MGAYFRGFISCVGHTVYGLALSAASLLAALIILAFTFVHREAVEGMAIAACVFVALFAGTCAAWLLVQGVAKKGVALMVLVVTEPEPSIRSQPAPSSAAGNATIQQVKHGYSENFGVGFDYLMPRMAAALATVVWITVAPEAGIIPATATAFLAFVGVYFALGTFYLVVKGLMSLVRGCLVALR